MVKTQNYRKNVEIPNLFDIQIQNAKTGYEVKIVDERKNKSNTSNNAQKEKK